MKFIFIIITFTILIQGCTKNVESINQIGLIKKELFDKAELVFRVKLLEHGEGSQFLWSKVKILEVYKKPSGYIVKPEIFIAHYSIKNDLPDGEFTIYLTYYDEAKKEWMLLNGDPDFGVSDCKTARRQKQQNHSNKKPNPSQK